MKVIAHDGVGVNATGKNPAQFQNTLLNPRFSVFEGFFQVFVEATQPRAPNAAGNAVDRIRLLALGCSGATLFARRVIPAVSMVRVGFAASVCGVGLQGKSDWGACPQWFV